MSIATKSPSLSSTSDLYLQRTVAAVCTCYGKLNVIEIDYSTGLRYHVKKNAETRHTFAMSFVIGFKVEDIEDF